MEKDTKAVFITGGAMTEGGKIKTRKPRTKKNKQEGGDPLAPMSADIKSFNINTPATPCPIPQVSTALPFVAHIPPTQALAPAPIQALAPTSVGGA